MPLPETVATLGFADDHVIVGLLTIPFGPVATAVTFAVAPIPVMGTLEGDTVTAVTMGACTTTRPRPDTPPDVAVIVATPGPRAVTRAVKPVP
jgi:hypothetical protein